MKWTEEYRSECGRGAFIIGVRLNGSSIVTPRVVGKSGIRPVPWWIWKLWVRHETEAIDEMKCGRTVRRNM